MIPESLQRELEALFFRGLDSEEALAKIEAIAAARPEHAVAIRTWLAALRDPIDDGPGDAPRRIGPYVLERVLGRGGSSVVYVARQEYPVQRPVALKLLEHGLDSHSILARFTREQEALARMNHDCVARIYDAGQTGSGQPWFAMELIEGSPITEHCDAHGLMIGERVALFAEVCLAVHHAHQKGVIHRDLKPGNILVTTIGKRHTPKLIDFGIADAAEGATIIAPAREVGIALGTPAYMAPEQSRGDFEQIDTRTDVYALGVVFHEILTGRTLRGQAPPPTPSPNRRSTGDELSWIVDRALATAPEKRYPSAAEFAADLHRFLRREPVLAGPASPGYRFRKFVSRHRLAIASSVAVTATLLAGAWSTWHASKDAERHQAESLAANARLQTRNEAMHDRDAVIRELQRQVAEMRSHGLQQPDQSEAAPYPRLSPGAAPSLVRLSLDKLIPRSQWSAVEPIENTCSERSGHGAAIDSIPADESTLLARMRTLQRQAHAMGQCDIGHHFVVDADGTIVKGRLLQWCGHSVSRGDVDAVLVGLVVTQGRGVTIEQRAATFQLLDALIADSIIDATPLDVIDEGMAADSLQETGRLFESRFDDEARNRLVQHLVDVSRVLWLARDADTDKMERMGAAVAITLHHSAVTVADTSLASTCAHVRAIEEEHRAERGLGDIAYHFLVDAVGRVVEGRSLTHVGAHAGEAANAGNIGVCLLGDFDSAGHDSGPTPKQLEALRGLIDALSLHYSIPPRMCLGHSELRSTGCPGHEVMQWLRAYRSERAIRGG